MSIDEFAPRAQMLDELGQLAARQASGFLTVFTESNRSVMISLHDGKITGFQARTREAEESIQLLRESASVKTMFNETDTDAEDEILTVADFSAALGAAATAAPAPANDSANNAGIRAVILDIAVDYIGIMAETVVDEALAAANDPNAVVDYIAGAIPDKGQASAFKTAAKGVI